MGLFFGNLFWGILLILWGASLILKSFGINLPLAKIFFAVIIILFGIKLLVGGSFRASIKGVKTNRVSGESADYSTVFASQKIDLSHVRPGDKPIEINVVFGSAEVILPDDVAFKFDPTTVFGTLITPAQSYFGVSNSANTINPEAEGSKVQLEINTVFGRTQIVVKKSRAKAYEAPADSTSNEGSSF